ncbi:MAG: gfo/Idh/MocA family oxidoreductase, partial [Pseudomonadota bacterium]
NTDQGDLNISDGGASMQINGESLALEGRKNLFIEYEAIYSNFKRLIDKGGLEVDVTPLQLVADCFLSAERVQND